MKKTPPQQILNKKNLYRQDCYPNNVSVLFATARLKQWDSIFFYILCVEDCSELNCIHNIGRPEMKHIER